VTHVQFFFVEFIRYYPYISQPMTQRQPMQAILNLVYSCLYPSVLF
jgi:hypothetical protein